MIAVYTTTVANNTQARQTLTFLKTVSPDAKINFDLSDGEKILRVDGSLASIRAITDYLNISGIQFEILA